MEFPNFLIIATFPKTRLLEVNKTLVKKQFNDHAEGMWIKIFSEYLGFSYQLVSSDDGEFGRRLSDGNWTRLVGMLHRKEADLVFHIFAITEERTEVLDYSYPYYIDRLVFATRHFERSSNKDAFLKPFSLNVWIAFAICCCIMPIIFSVLFGGRKHFFRRLISCDLFKKLPSAAKRRYAEGTLKIFWEVSILFLRWFYIALVLSFLTLPSLTGIKTIPELAAAVSEGTYECTGAPGAYVASALIKAGGSSSVIGNNLKDGEGTLDFEIALKRTGLTKKTAVIASDTELLYLKEKYFVSDDKFFPILFGIGISKDFCCKGQLDFLINYLWPAGIYQHLLQYAFLVEEFDILKQSPFDVEHQNSLRSLSLEDFKGVFFLLAAGYALSFVVLFIEIAHSQFENLKI